MKDWSSEHWFVVVVGGIGIAISVCAATGLFEFLSTGCIINFILFALSTIMLFLAFERRVLLGRVNAITSKLGETTTNLTAIESNIINSLDGVEIKVFANGNELYQYVICRMREASNISDLTWGASSRENTLADDRAYNHYVDSIAMCCNANDGLYYREIMSLPVEDHVIKAKRLLVKKMAGYRLACYVVDHNKLSPLMSFMIIDNSEVVVVYYASDNTGSDTKIRLAIKNTEIVSLFQNYYNGLWQKAERVPDMDKLNELLGS